MSIMSLRTILHYPNPKLRFKAEEVVDISAEIGVLIDDMFETMYEDNGVGLAATQIGILYRIAVMDVSENKNQPIVLINPKIIETSASKKKGPEGCLSVPGIMEKVERAEIVKVKALDRDGKEIEIEADDLLAVCIQHELDHLDGTLFIDHLSPLKKQLIKKKLKKLHKSNL